jgi:hypothetical protein
MCEAEVHTGVGAGDKASTDRCWWVLRVRRAAKYGDIGIFGGVAGRGMCEAEEHTGVGAGDKASSVRCWWVLRVR